MSEREPKPGFPSFYAWALPGMVEVGREMGWAIALHGSLGYDMDVVAVPWTEDAAYPSDLIAAIGERVGLHEGWEDAMRPERKPHGRIAYTLMWGGGAHIDLSVMPRATDNGSQDDG